MSHSKVASKASYFYILGVQKLINFGVFKQFLAYFLTCLVTLFDLKIVKKWNISGIFNEFLSI